jgi:hypothetical protein
MTEDSRERPEPDPAMSAFAAGLERWAMAMQALARTPPGSPDFQQAMLSLQSDLATQLEAWLRTSHPLTGLCSGPPMAPFGSASSATVGGAARIASLLNQWVGLQGQLAGHWSTVGRAAAEKFAMRLGNPTVSGPFTDLRKLYDLYIDCAEEAYAETAHSEGFARSTADLINTAVALQLEGRQYLQQSARAAGLPTREEVDALRRRIDQLEQLRRRRLRPKSSRKNRRKRKRQS